MKLDTNLIRDISAKRGEPEWLLDWRLGAFDAWQKMPEPHWAKIDYDPIDYDDLNYYNEPRPVDNSDLKSVYEKMGMATDLVIDSRSVSTSYKEALEKLGIIFKPFSEAVKSHPELIKKYLGTVVPRADNFFAALNASVFSDGTFVYIPPNTKCPMDLASYFRIETAKIAQFERTLIIVDTGAEVSYLEGCSAPRRPNHQLHSGVVEVIAMPGAIVKYATVQNWSDNIFNFVTKRAIAHENAKMYWTQVEVGSAKTWKYPSTILRGSDAHSDFYSLTITRGIQQADTGTKMIHVGDATTSNIVSYGVALEESKQTFRSLVSFVGTGGKNASKCDSRIIGDTAVANTLPTIIHNNGENDQSFEATTGAIDATALLYLNQAGIKEDEATALIVGGMAAPIISRLPMEFLVESKQLIKMALSHD